MCVCVRVSCLIEALIKKKKGKKEDLKDEVVFFFVVVVANRRERWRSYAAVFFFTDRELAHIHIYINKGSVSVCGFCFFFFSLIVCLFFPRSPVSSA